MTVLGAQFGGRTKTTSRNPQPRSVAETKPRNSTTDAPSYRALSRDKQIAGHQVFKNSANGEAVIFLRKNGRGPRIPVTSARAELLRRGAFQLTR